MDAEAFFLPNIGDEADKSSDLKNCIRNNYRHLRKWAKRTETNCFRIYDRQIKAYPIAIDYYDTHFCVHFFTTTREDELPSEHLYAATAEAICSLFTTTEDAIYWRTRIKREKTEQYEKSANKQQFFTVVEHGALFKINLVDYLDTGLFLDHRETRQIVAAASKGKRLLNLFSYTCSFSVHAAIQGALYTKSVDMSNTYTDWGRDNFELNHLPAATNEIVRADCLKFLKEERGSSNRYDIIVIDPPTISRSKKMDQMFDVQEDYISLIQGALRLLLPGGSIFFSTNSRRFTFDETPFPDCKIIDISKKTLPLDFHDPKIHYCWKISKKDNS